MVWMALAFYVPMAALSLAILLWRHGLGFFVPAPGWFPWTLLAAGIGLAIVVLSKRLLTFEWAREMESEFVQILGPITAQEAAILAVASGIGEEYFFRGVLLPPLGLVWSSIVFGAVHFPMTRKLIAWTPFALAMGLILGWLYVASGSLIPSIVTHAVINGINLFFIGEKARELGVPRRDFPPTEPPPL